MIVLGALGIALAALVAGAARRPGLARIAFRQASSRRAQALVVVAGLMLGGASLTASLIAIDSAQRLSTQIERLRWDATDVTVTSDRPFPAELADIAAADPDVREATKSVVPQLAVGATLADVSSQRTEASASLIGFDAQHDLGLGPFWLVDGTTINAVGPRSILLNERTATRLAAKAGDTITITLQSTGESVSLGVRGIARMRGKAAWGFDPLGFVPLELAQKLAKAPGRVNVLRVVAPADPARAVAALDDSLARSGLPLHAIAARQDGLRAASAQTRFLRYALIAMSAFLVIAGILLIVNLVVMLADERAQHLGMLRALGMRRGALVLIGAIEGALYSVVAGALGAFAGLGFGVLLAHILQDAFQRFFLPGGAALPFLYHPPANAVIVGGAGGTLLGLLTMIAAWRRASLLNVSAALRGVRATVSPRTSATARPGRRRLRVSLAGLAIAAWVLVTAALSHPPDPRSAMQLLVGLNVVFVFSLSILAAANTGVLERGAALLGQWSAGARQTLRPVLAYLAQRPLRTGLTIGVFGIVLSLVTAAASVLAADKPRYEEDTSGFQVVASTMGTTPVDLRGSRDIAAWRAVPFKVYHGGISIPHRKISELTMTVYEATPALADLALGGRDPSFTSDRQAWQQVISGDRAIGSLGAPGEPMEFDGANTTVVNAGSLRAARLLLGALVSPSRFADIPGDAGTTYLIRTKPGVEPSGLVRSLEKQWFADGLDASTSRALIDRGREDLRAFFAIIEFMTKLALGIGILALGIIGLRAAVERRQMLGTLRALGYRRRTVGMALLVEAAIVTTAGTVVGAGGGLLLNRVFLGRGAAGIDGGALAGTLALTYIAALLAAAGPAMRVARMRPADAVRTID